MFPFEGLPLCFFTLTTQCSKSIDPCPGPLNSFSVLDASSANGPVDKHFCPLHPRLLPRACPAQSVRVPAALSPRPALRAEWFPEKHPALSGRPSSAGCGIQSWGGLGLPFEETLRLSTQLRCCALSCASSSSISFSLTSRYWRGTNWMPASWENMIMVFSPRFLCHFISLRSELSCRVSDLI